MLIAVPNILVALQLQIHMHESTLQVKNVMENCRIANHFKESISWTHNGDYRDILFDFIIYFWNVCTQKKKKLYMVSIFMLKNIKTLSKKQWKQGLFYFGNVCTQKK